MSFTSAFLQRFADTTLEMQKRNQEQKQFEATLAVHQMALQTQQQKFNQELQLREAERQDRLQQNQIENQFAAEKGARETAMNQSLMKTREENTQGKALAEANNVALQATAQQFSKGLTDLRLKRAQLQGSTDPKAATQIQAIDQEISDQESKLAPIQRYLQKFYQEREADGQTAPAPAGSETVKTATGQTQAGPLTGQAQPQAAAEPNPMQPRQDQIQAAAPPATQVQAPTPLSAEQVTAATTRKPTVESNADLRHITDDPALAERNNARAKELGLDETWTTPEQLAEADRKRLQDQMNATIAEAATAADKRSVGQISDALRNHGLEGIVAPEAHEKGTSTVSARIGGRIGGMLMQSGITFGMTKGHAEQTWPSVEFNTSKATVPSWVPFAGGVEVRNSDPSLPYQISQALVDQDKLTPISQPWVDALQNTIRKGASNLGAAGQKGSVTEAAPFDGVLNPDRHQKAVALVMLHQAEDNAAKISKLPYESVGLGTVKDVQTSTPETLGLFGKTIDKLSDKWASDSKRKAEGETIKELESRLRPDNPDGTFSPAARQAAQDAMGRLDKAAISPEFRQQALDILRPIAAPGKKTSMAEPAQGGGALSMRSAATLSALGGLSNFGAEKAKTGKPASAPASKPAPAPASKPAPAPAPKQEPAKASDAGSVTKEFAPVKSAQDREGAAKDAAEKIKTAFAGLTKDTDKDAVRKQWASTRGIWKSYGVTDETLAKIDAIIGKSKSAEEKTSDIAKEIDQLTKKKG